MIINENSKINVHSLKAALDITDQLRNKKFPFELEALVGNEYSISVGKDRSADRTQVIIEYTDDLILELIMYHDGI